MGDWLQDRCNSIQKAQQEHIQKSFSEDFEKARSGVYKPTKQNLKEGKAGQKYGSEKKEDETLQKINIINSAKSRLKNVFRIHIDSIDFKNGSLIIHSTDKAYGDSYTSKVEYKDLFAPDSRSTTDYRTNKNVANYLYKDILEDTGIKIKSVIFSTYYD